MIKRFKRTLFKDIRHCMSFKNLIKENRRLRNKIYGLSKLLTQVTFMLIDGFLPLDKASKILKTDEKTLKEWISFGHLPRVEGMGQFYLPTALIFDLFSGHVNDNCDLRRNYPLTPGEAIEATKKYYEWVYKKQEDHAED